MELSCVPVAEKQRGTCSEHEADHEARGGMRKAATRLPEGEQAAPRPLMP